MSLFKKILRNREVYEFILNFNPSVRDSVLCVGPAAAKFTHFGLWEEIARDWEIVEFHE